jgi:inorganic phosphate transporter, PiT family
MSVFTLAVLIIAIALVFDYINGFHDAANSIATIVATRVLTPFQAVLWAAFFNFVAAFLFGTAVAKTVGKGFVDIGLVTPYVIMAGLVGAIVWDLITWYLGLPTSSSHALIGGYAGAAMARVGLLRGFGHSMEALNVSSTGEWPFTLKMIIGAPLIGMVSAYTLMVLVYWLFRRSTPSKMDKYFRKLQLLSAAAFSMAHGSNDAQKTMGIITGALVTGGFLSKFEVPFWVELLSYTAIALGTLSGGWRIIKTMGTKITKLTPAGGFAAETGAAVAIYTATALGVGISTTHTITGAIVGVGATRRLSAVRWGLAGQILWAWILTIPASAFIGMTCYFIAELIR